MGRLDRKLNHYFLEYKDDNYLTSVPVHFAGIENGTRWEQTWTVSAEHITFLTGILRFEQPIILRDGVAGEEALLNNPVVNEPVGEQGLFRDAPDKSSGSLVRVVSYILKYYKKGKAEVYIHWYSKNNLQTKLIDVDAEHLHLVVEMLRNEQEVYYDTSKNIVRTAKTICGSLLTTKGAVQYSPHPDYYWYATKYIVSYDCTSHTHSIQLFNTPYDGAVPSGKEVLKVAKDTILDCNNEQANHIFKILQRNTPLYYLYKDFEKKRKWLSTGAWTGRFNDLNASPTGGESNPEKITKYSWTFQSKHNGLKIRFWQHFVRAQDAHFILDLLDHAKEVRTQDEPTSIYCDLPVGWKEYKESVSPGEAPPGFYTITRIREIYSLSLDKSSIVIYWKNETGEEKGRIITPLRSFLVYFQDLLKWEAPVYWNPLTKEIISGKEMVGEEERGYTQAQAHPEKEKAPLPVIMPLASLIGTFTQAINATPPSDADDETAEDEIDEDELTEEPLSSEYIPIINTNVVLDKKADFTFTWKKRAARQKATKISLKAEFASGMADLLEKKRCKWFHEPTGEIRFVFKPDESGDRPLAKNVRKVATIIASLSTKLDKPKITVYVQDRNVAPVLLDASEKQFANWVALLVSAKGFLWNADTKQLEVLF